MEHSGSPTVSAYLSAARIAVSLLGDPAVHASWDRGSALAGYRVDGLAGHLATQLFAVEDTLVEPLSGYVVDDLLAHYSRVSWIGADVDAEVSVSVRSGGERQAADGPDVLVARSEESLERLHGALADRHDDEVVKQPWNDWSMRLDHFLVTRMMEIAVHVDDLAVSVDVVTPSFPPDVLRPVLALLTDLAVARHGQPALLRTLARAERAPHSVAAF